MISESLGHHNTYYLPALPTFKHDVSRDSTLHDVLLPPMPNHKSCGMAVTLGLQIRVVPIGGCLIVNTAIFVIIQVGVIEENHRKWYRWLVVKDSVQLGIGSLELHNDVVSLCDGGAGVVEVSFHNIPLIFSFRALSLELTSFFQESGDLSMKRVGLFLGSRELSFALAQLLLQLITSIALNDELSIIELLKKISLLQLASMQFVLKDCDLCVMGTELGITGCECGLQCITLLFQLENACGKVLGVFHELANNHLSEGSFESMSQNLISHKIHMPKIA